MDLVHKSARKYKMGQSSHIVIGFVAKDIVAGGYDVRGATSIV